MKLILFDIDGTLLSSDGAGRRAVHRALLEVFGGIGPEDHHFDGKTDPQIVRELMRMEGHHDERIDASMDELFARYLRHLATELRDPVCHPRALPGVPALLEALAGNRSVVLGLLTGNLVEGARAKLEAVGIDPDVFAVGAYGSDHEDRPELPLIARRRAKMQLNVDIEGRDVVVIGDTPADIGCGAAAGATTIGVATGRYRTGELLQCGADWVFENLSDTAAVLSALLSDG